MICDININEIFPPHSYLIHQSHFNVFFIYILFPLGKLKTFKPSKLSSFLNLGIYSSRDNFHVEHVLHQACRCVSLAIFLLDVHYFVLYKIRFRRSNIQYSVFFFFFHSLSYTYNFLFRYLRWVRNSVCKCMLIKLLLYPKEQYRGKKNLITSIFSLWNFLCGPVMNNPRSRMSVGQHALKFVQEYNNWLWKTVTSIAEKMGSF